MGVRFSLFGRSGNFSPLHRVQAGSGTHRASCPRGTEESFQGLKVPGHESNHLLPSSTEIENSGVRPQLPSTSSWHGVANLTYSFTVFHFLKASINRNCLY
jgi:hypothetical protein